MFKAGTDVKEIGLPNVRLHRQSLTALSTRPSTSRNACDPSRLAKLHPNLSSTLAGTRPPGYRTAGAGVPIVFEEHLLERSPVDQQARRHQQPGARTGRLPKFPRKIWDGF